MRGGLVGRVKHLSSSFDARWEFMVRRRRVGRSLLFLFFSFFFKSCLWWSRGIIRRFFIQLVSQRLRAWIFIPALEGITTRDSLALGSSFLFIFFFYRSLVRSSSSSWSMATLLKSICFSILIYEIFGSTLWKNYAIRTL